MRLFSINGVDLTNHITVPSYSVNQISSYINWQSASYVNHRYVTRKVVSGTFTIYFDDPSEYFEFLDLINRNTNTLGYIPGVEVYCNNIKDIVTADIFLDFTPVNDLPFYGAKQHDGYQITIQER